MSTHAVHVPPIGADFTGCVGLLIEKFVRVLAVEDLSCAQEVRPIRTVPIFAERVDQVAPASPEAGNQGTDADLRFASAAAETVGDVLARQFVNYSGSGVGLKGAHSLFKRRRSGMTFS